jgi:hypothetical protein
MHILMKCTVQEAVIPTKKISSGSVAQRGLILALKVNYARETHTSLIKIVLRIAATLLNT